MPSEKSRNNNDESELFCFLTLLNLSVEDEFEFHKIFMADTNCIRSYQLL